MYQVSILTRPRGRVLPVVPVDKINIKKVSILTRPRGRVLQLALDDISIVPLFQSSPAHVGGCFTISTTTGLSTNCFNPHPPTWAGASGQGVDGPDRFGVSILTRPRGRVLREKAETSTIMGSVSILTRPRGRVLPGLGPDQSQTFQFQSSPAHVGGCFRQRGGPSRSIKLFQSSPAHVGGCFIPLHLSSLAAAEFQSSPAHVGGCFCSCFFCFDFNMLRNIFCEIIKSVLNILDANTSLSPNILIKAVFYLSRILRLFR